MRQTGEPNSSLTVVIGAVSVLLLVVAVVALQAYYHEAEEDEDARKVVAVGSDELAQARAQQLEQIHSYRWIDQKAGVASIPIDTAMEMVVRDGVRAMPAPAPTPATVGGTPKAKKGT